MGLGKMVIWCSTTQTLYLNTLAQSGFFIAFGGVKNIDFEVIKYYDSQAGSWLAVIRFTLLPMIEVSLNGSDSACMLQVINYRCGSNNPPSFCLILRAKAFHKVRMFHIQRVRRVITVKLDKYLHQVKGSTL